MRVLSVFLLSFILLLAGCEQNQFASKVELDKPFPEMSLKTIDGKEVRLAELHGKVVVLKLWATWCSICMESEPAFKAFIAKLDKKRVAVVSLSVDSDVNLLKEYLLDHPSDHLQLLDFKMQQTNAVLGLNTVPQAFIIDQQGVLRYHAVGRTVWGEDKRNLIESLASDIP